MNTPLIGLDKLLSQSWKDMWSEWRPTLGWTLGMVFVPVLLNIAFALPQIAEPKLAENPIYQVCAFILTYAASIYFIVGLYRYFLDKKPNISVSAQDVVAIALIGALGGIILIPAFLLFILPGIWLSIMFCFAIPVYLKEGKKGWSALKTSYDIVKGRWWATFVRLLVPQIVYGIGLSMIMGILAFTYALVVGLSLKDALAPLAENAPIEQIFAAINPSSIAIAGIGGVALIIVLIIISILITLARVSVLINLYKSLSETASK